MEDKTCIKCNILKPITSFQFRTDTKKYRNECNDCKKIKNPNYKGYKSILQRSNENKASEKICTKCAKCKPLDQYQKRTDNKTLSYRNDCIECRNDYVSEFKRTSEKTKKRQNEVARERRKNDPCFLINSRIIARLRK
jgi:hypothetical protein